MPLLRNGKLESSPWQAHSTDEPPAAFRYVSLADYQLNAQAWHKLQSPWFVVVEPDDDLEAMPRALLDEPRLGISFPQFTDGRGYSQARLLREHYGYTGELAATGDVRRDQIDFMARVGIDSFLCADDINLDSWRKALRELHVEDLR